MKDKRIKINLYSIVTRYFSQHKMQKTIAVAYRVERNL